MKKAIITGITGQDGAYLAKFLLEKNYQVFGTYRRLSNPNFSRLEYLNIVDNKNLYLTELDLTDLSSIYSTIKKIKPDEIYNLAAQSFVGVSFEQPITTSNINFIGTLNFLEAIKSIDKNIKFYQASTSEMFGLVQEVPQSETTPFYPRSPYGVSKLAAHWMSINYRESYDMFIAIGILFNHESPIRGIEFVTRKITDAIAKIKFGVIESFKLGNLDAQRDWGYALDYVEGMWKMLQYEKPETFILATNNTYKIRDFLKLAFKLAEMDVEFNGDGSNEKVINKKNGKVLVEIDKKYYRPSEVDLLIGNYDKAKKLLNWVPKTDINQLCHLMIEADMKRVASEN